MKAFIAIVAVLALASAAPKLGKNPIRVIKPHPHVIGGEEAKPHSIPYAAFLQIEVDGFVVTCAGALISENYVLTTAVCLDGASSVSVILGAHNYQEDEATQVQLTSTSFTIHEDYNESLLTNDIAVIKLPEPVKLTNDIKPLPLPTDSSKEYTGALASISSWGVTHIDDSSISDVLNVVELEVISNAVCASYYGFFVVSSTLCTASKENAGACYGDAGGPLVSDGVLIGVQSFVANDCLSGPAGFSRTTSYLDWLKANTDV